VRASSSAGDEWTVIAHFSSGVRDADIAVSKLHGSGIPAMRFPFNSACYPVVGQALEGVRVLVPPDRADEARQVLDTFSEIPR